MSERSESRVTLDQPRHDLESNDDLVRCVAMIVSQFSGLSLPLEWVSQRIWDAVALGYSSGQSSAAAAILANMRKRGAL